MNTTQSGTGVRVATAAMLVPVTVAAVWYGPLWLVALLVALVTLAGVEEFLALGAQQGLGSYRWWTDFCALAVVAAQWNAAAGGRWTGGSARRWLVSGDGPPAMGVELALLAFVLGIAAMVVLGHRALKDVLPSVGTSGAALLLIALPFSHMVRLHGLDDGRIWLLFTLALVWLGDTLAYFIGRRVGRLPLAPQISPKKTWEGAAANVVGALLAAAVFSMWLDVGVMHLFTIALLASVAGQFGDLLESAYKRGAGVKESGALLPGHGGLLDRVDALIFAAPVVWVYAARLY